MTKNKKEVTIGDQAQIRKLGQKHNLLHLYDVLYFMSLKLIPNQKNRSQSPFFPVLL